MLSPDSSPIGKPHAPSIWSFDSGYGTTAEEKARSGRFYHQPSTSSNSLQGRLEENVGFDLGGFSNFHIGDQRPRAPRIEESPVDPLDTRSNFPTTYNTTNNNFCLPEIPSATQACITCDLFRVSNPGEGVRCENCRIPEIIEPSLLCIDGSSKGKQPVNIPQAHKVARAMKSDQPQLQLQTRCSACELSSFIGTQNPSNCPTCNKKRRDTLSSPSPLSASGSDHMVKRSRAGRSSKLPLSALNTLQSWLDANTENPYPSAEVKRQLAHECGITEKQVTTWFTNARARQLSPLETWLSSGSEEDVAEEEAIERASTELTTTGGFAYISDNRNPGNMRTGSISGSSAAGQARPKASRRGKKKNYRRNNQSPQNNELLSPASASNTPIIGTTPGEQEMWQCTFCRQWLVPKSWRRHEETQHHTRAQWTCMLYGPRLTQSPASNSARPNTSSSYCAFCLLKDPSEEHFLTHHRISECAKRPTSDRTFYRPDHLRQHVKNFHGTKLTDLAQTKWKCEGDKGKQCESWICGFCGEGLDTWGKRETHIAGHFKDGLTMESWRDFTSPKEKRHRKKDSKDVAKEKEREHHGLARIGRSFTRRPARSSQRTEAPEIPFANAFEPLPIQPSMTMGYTYPHTQAPVLPDINMDPLMADPNYAFGQWPSMAQMQPQPTHFTTGLGFDPTVVTVDTDFNNPYTSIGMDFGNPMAYHNHWDHQQ